MAIANGADAPPTSPPRRARRPWWRAVLVALVLVVGVAVAWSYLVPRPSGITGAPSPTPTPTPSPTPSIPQIARQEVWTSDTPSTGEYRSNTVTLEPATVNERVVDYVVKVESSVDIDPDEAARSIQATLDDPRGWAGYGRTSFRAVTAETDTTLSIYLAAPDSAQKLCAPADIARKWNCRVGDDVILNTDRWLYMTPTYDDLAEYRAYLVNHEVGHSLSHPHEECPAPGQLAPIMLQQTLTVGECVPNGWPAP